MSSEIGLALATPRIVREDRADGSFVLRSETPLQPFARCIGDWLEHWAAKDPNHLFLAERYGAGWRRLSYGRVLAAVRSLAQALLDLELPPQAPVVALSDNSINLALLSLAAMHIGRPVAVVSSAYSRLADGHGWLYEMLDRLAPGVIYAESAAEYGAAIAAWQPRCPVLYTSGAAGAARAFADWLERVPGPAVQQAFAALDGQTVARLMLTSGSTGRPKLVPNTQAMLCANQQMIAQCWPFVDGARPVVLDWLPWSHTFGANHNFNLVLRNGGSLYIDSGRPLPGAIEATVQAIREVGPTLFFNVPKGYQALLPYLEADAALAKALFGRLDLLFFAAAELPAETARRLRAVAARARAAPLFLSTEWGSTETSPVVTSAHFHSPDTRNIGVPVPGIELKFVPSQEKYELRVRGPSVFPGYLDAPELNAQAFDEEGFYRMGDAGLLADPADASAGVIFDGRVAEDFKLGSGTWVSVGPLRARCAAALAPYAQDVVVAGQGRDEIGLLIFPAPALRQLAGVAGGALDGAALGRHPALRAALAPLLAALGAGLPSSRRPARAVLLSSPPSLERGELTDKGYVNQRAVLAGRAAEVARLYSDDASVIYPR